MSFEKPKEIEARFICECPCGGRISEVVGEIEGHPALTHTMPPCTPFLELSLNRFLQYVRYCRMGIEDN